MTRLFLTALLLFPVFAQAQSIISLIKEGNLEEARVLVETNNELVNSTDENGASAFMWALNTNNAAFARYLYKKEASPYQKGIIHFSQNAYFGSPLSIAVTKCDINTIQFLIEECGIDANDRELNLQKEEKGWTPLHWLATRKDSIDLIFKYLIKQGADVNIEDEDGNTPLLLAASYHNRPLVKQLLKHGVLPDHKNNYGYSALSLARDDFETTKLIYDHNPEPGFLKTFGSYDLRKLLFKKDYAYAHWLLSNGLCIDCGGLTMLHQAAILEEPELVQFLINRGANVNATDRDGKTPLHKAVEFDYYSTIKILLSNGADVDKVDKDGWTPLRYTCTYKLDPLALRILVNAGADINFANNQQNNWSDTGHTLLTKVVSSLGPEYVTYLFELGAKATAHNQEINYRLLDQLLIDQKFEIVNELAKNGFQIDVKDNYGTPLIIKLAEDETRTDELKAFLKAGANPDITNEYNETALMKAIKKSISANVSSLLKYGANVNHKKETTPLHVAASKKNLSILKLLLKNGADVNAKDKYGNTPLLQTIRYQSGIDMSEALLADGADINASNKKGASALSLTLEFEGPAEEIKWVMGNGFDLEEHYEILMKINPYFYGNEHLDEDMKLLSILLEGDLSNWPRVDAYRQRLLNKALSYSKDVYVKQLIELGAKVNELDNYESDLPIHYLAKHANHLSSFEILSRYKPDVHAVSKNGKTPLQIAYKEENLLAMCWLLRNDAHVEQLPFEEMPAVYKDISQGKNESLKQLLQNNNNRLSRYEYHIGPFAWAILFDNKEAFEVLLENELPLSFYSQDFTELFLESDIDWVSILRKHEFNFESEKNLFAGSIFLLKPKVSKQLINYGFDPTAHEWVPHGIIQIGNNELLEELLELGVDPNVPMDGKTPVENAHYFGNYEAVRILFEAGADISGYEENLLHHLLDRKSNLAFKTYQSLDKKPDLNKEKYKSVSLAEKIVASENIAFVKSMIRDGNYPAQEIVQNERLLKAAIKTGNTKLLEMLLSVSEIDNLSEHQLFDLLTTALPDHPKMLEKLIKHGIDINTTSFDLTLFGLGINDNWPIAHFKTLEKLGFNFKNEVEIGDALENSRFDVLQLIEKSQQVISKLNKDAWQQLMVASANDNNAEAIKFLTKSREHDGADLYDALTQACVNGNEGIVKLLLEYGAVYNKGNTLDYYGPIIKAVENEYYDLLPLFLEKGFDINDTTKYGHSIANYVAVSKRYDALEKLTTWGLSPDHNNDLGEYHPLSQAIKYRSVKYFNMALSAGANINIVPFQGPLLNQAIVADFQEVVQVLLKKEVNPELTDRFGNTALHTAVSMGDSVITQLLKYVKDPNTKSRIGETPLHIACKTANIYAVKALIEKGAAVDIKNKDGETPLMLAALTGNKVLCELLMKDSQGSTTHAIEYAQFGGSQEVINMMK